MFLKAREEAIQRYGETDVAVRPARRE